MVFFPDTCAAPTDRKRLTRKKRGTCLSRTAEETWLPAPTETAQIKDTQKIKRDPIISFILITGPSILILPRRTPCCQLLRLAIDRSANTGGRVDTWCVRRRGALQFVGERP